MGAIWVINRGLSLKEVRQNILLACYQEMRIEKGNTFGLAIDIQERLFPAMCNKEELLKNCRILIQGLKILGVPLIVTQQYTKGLGGTIEEVGSLVPGFEPIEKNEFSCYDNHAFAGELKNFMANNIIICGIEAHVCVLQTAVDLKEAGFNPVVVMDCVSSRSEKSIALSVERFRHEGIMMASAESILFELARKAGTAEFKSVSKLVK